jgi:hypothetical protein
MVRSAGRRRLQHHEGRQRKADHADIGVSHAWPALSLRRRFRPLAPFAASVPLPLLGDQPVGLFSKRALFFFFFRRGHGAEQENYAAVAVAFSQQRLGGRAPGHGSAEARRTHPSRAQSRGGRPSSSKIATVRWRGRTTRDARLWSQVQPHPVTSGGVSFAEIWRRTRGRTDEARRSRSCGACLTLGRSGMWLRLAVRSAPVVVGPCPCLAQDDLVYRPNRPPHLAIQWRERGGGCC